MAAPTMDPLSAEIYKQNCEDLRFYGDMRFKQLTLWSVGIGFLLNVSKLPFRADVVLRQR
jgi:hypothetical protein